MNKQSFLKAAGMLAFLLFFLFTLQAKTTDCETPVVFNLTGAGYTCYGPAVTFGLDGSETGVNYQLKRGSANLGSPIAGTGAAISFPATPSPGIYTVVATTATGDCTATMSGNAAIVNISFYNPNNLPDGYITGACNGQNTTCLGDDTFTSDVTVTYEAKPASGTLTLSCPLLVGTAPVVDVSEIGATSHTFTGVTFQANGQNADLTATFSAGCSRTIQSLVHAPTCI
ncbi:MAG: hypothetical protein AAB316_02865, partial [Bacteroidota bacterium]